jgi:hypothetical protein
MRRVSVCLLLVLLSAGTAYPCGDKLALMNRGVRMQRALAARKPLSILIYGGGSMRPADVDSLRNGLSHGGHRIDVASTHGELEAMLGRPHDLVLAAKPDLAEVESWVAETAPRPVVIRVLQNPAKQEWRQELGRCPLVIRTSGDTIEQLAAVASAMQVRSHGADGCTR